RAVPIAVRHPPSAARRTIGLSVTNCQTTLRSESGPAFSGKKRLPWQFRLRRSKPANVLSQLRSKRAAYADIAHKCARQRLLIAPAERLGVSRHSAIEDARELVHAFWHRQVSHAVLAQARVEILEELVHIGLRQRLRFRRSLQAHQRKSAEHRKELESPIQRV